MADPGSGGDAVVQRGGLASRLAEDMRNPGRFEHACQQVPGVHQRSFLAAPDDSRALAILWCSASLSWYFEARRRSGSNRLAMRACAAASASDPYVPAPTPASSAAPSVPGSATAE